MSFQLSYLQKAQISISVKFVYMLLKSKDWEKCEITCKPVEVLKIETVFPVQTRSFFPSFEKAGGEETKLLPPSIISVCTLEHEARVSGQLNVRFSSNPYVKP